MEDTQLMELFLGSCRNAADYPKNLVYHNPYEHSLVSYWERLDEQKSRLFFDETKAAVDFWDYDHQAQNQGALASSIIDPWRYPSLMSIGFWHSCIKDVNDLDKHLGIALLPGQRDPRCRFM